MKKVKLVLSIIGGLFVVFLIITLFNTLTLKTLQPAPKTSTSIINEDQAIQHLSKAITFKTISYQDRSKFDLTEFDRFISFLKESYPLVDKRARIRNGE
ncbi:MAG: hypothetical protein WB217_05055 [Mesobacillus sp.]|uniref:hypothetical protein n=1 Tax=Mesobacillus sp. TaxID=2675271 RepID=UPI003C61D504